MNDFASFLRGAGLIPGDILQDGKWRRCATEDHPKKRNGSYKLAPDGLVGWCQDFATMSEPITWRPDHNSTPSPIDFAAIARRRAEERRIEVRATQAASRYYLDCKPLIGGHPYLEQHGLKMDGCFGLKSDGGWLVIPVLKDRFLMSVQRINQGGEKLFWPGAPVKAGSYTIDRRGAQVLVLCEGLATGLAIFAAVPTARVVVAFNSGNMAHVAIPRHGLVCVAADNDSATEARIGRNPGLKAAQEAADALGCGIAVPTGIQGSDWADYRNERISAMLIDRLKMQESEIRRAIDGEISAAIMRNATFLRGMAAA
ncbi:MAG: toprim domain-containing protein [Sulfuritalea sp.]|nr:toprim domain-containing protein [Sulfuritalea sp.]